MRVQRVHIACNRHHAARGAGAGVSSWEPVYEGGMLDQIWTPDVYAENVVEEKISKEYFWLNSGGRVYSW